jgi:hypothetical protein
LGITAQKLVDMRFEKMGSHLVPTKIDLGLPKKISYRRAFFLEQAALSYFQPFFQYGRIRSGGFEFFTNNLPQKILKMLLQTL